MAKANHVGHGARSGFTLVELLVVITIIGILMGLLIPAVNAARETARRNQCSTQINNLAKAAIQYEMAKKQFPGWVNDFGYFTAGDDPTIPTAVASAGHRKLGTWVVSLMPWLDAQATYEIWTQDKYPIVGPDNENNPIESGTNYKLNAAPNLAIMQCPSSPTTSTTHGRNSYIANNGFGRTFGSGTDYTAGTTGTSPAVPNDSLFVDSQKRANGVFTNKYQGTPATPNLTGGSVRLDDFKDGQGNTALFSENLQARSWHRVGALISTGLEGVPPTTGGGFHVAYPVHSRFGQGFVWHYRDEDSVASSTPAENVHRINGTNGTDDLFTLEMTDTNVANWNALARPSSAHNDGVNMGFADGSSRFVAQSISYRIYQAYMTPRGKSSDVPFKEFVLQGESL